MITQVTKGEEVTEEGRAGGRRGLARQGGRKRLMLMKGEQWGLLYIEETHTVRGQTERGGKKQTSIYEVRGSRRRRKRL